MCLISALCLAVEQARKRREHPAGAEAEAGAGAASDLEAELAGAGAAEAKDEVTYKLRVTLYIFSRICLSRFCCFANFASRIQSASLSCRLHSASVSV